ncbi:DUF6192 family protein [Streptomyces sp. NPDC015171]|uniref:DUF6192 family protein n=1 Tax=Streptomyces sp. NPDC015171 TaxID=3364945 RepID=UPI0036FEB752
MWLAEGLHGRLPRRVGSRQGQGLGRGAGGTGPGPSGGIAKVRAGADWLEGAIDSGEFTLDVQLAQLLRHEGESGRGPASAARRGQARQRVLRRSGSHRADGGQTYGPSYPPAHLRRPAEEIAGRLGDPAPAGRRSGRTPDPDHLGGAGTAICLPTSRRSGSSTRRSNSGRS